MTTGTCTYDRFETDVGEPRGVEHTGILGPRLVYTVYTGLHGRMTGFMTGFTDVLLSL